jgi:hypothetical protein
MAGEAEDSRSDPRFGCDDQNADSPCPETSRRNRQVRSGGDAVEHLQPARPARSLAGRIGWRPEHTSDSVEMKDVSDSAANRWRTRFVAS